MISCTPLPSRRGLCTSAQCPAQHLLPVEIKSWIRSIRIRHATDSLFIIYSCIYVLAEQSLFSLVNQVSVHRYSGEIMQMLIFGRAAQAETSGEKSAVCLRSSSLSRDSQAVIHSPGPGRRSTVTSRALTSFSLPFLTHLGWWCCCSGHVPQEVGTPLVTGPVPWGLRT